MQVWIVCVAQVGSSKEYGAVLAIIPITISINRRRRVFSPNCLVVICNNDVKWVDRSGICLKVAA